MYQLTVLLLIVVYVSLQSYMEYKHFHYIHETGIGILTGILFGWIANRANKEHNAVDFNQQIFFEIILPIIIFAAGFNLRREKFFANFGYISLYAVLGTVVNFIVTLVMMLALNKKNLFTLTNGEQITLSEGNILYFSATMCASDAVAALTLIKADKHPKLFSIIFGEGLVSKTERVVASGRSQRGGFIAILN